MPKRSKKPRIKTRPRKVFTTGEVAELCMVAPRTVTKWFDSGRLRGFRIPGSQDRRIPREHLERFLKENDMDDCLRKLQSEKCFLVVDPYLEEIPADPWTALPEPLAEALREHVPDAQITVFTDTFKAGMEAASGKYGYWVIMLQSDLASITSDNGQVVYQ